MTVHRRRYRGPSGTVGTPLLKQPAYSCHLLLMRCAFVFVILVTAAASSATSSSPPQPPSSASVSVSSSLRRKQQPQVNLPKRRILAFQNEEENIRQGDGGGDDNDRNARRRIQQQHSQLLSGRHTLLAVRVVSSFGEEPEESLDDIEMAVFGTTTSSSSSGNSAVLGGNGDHDRRNNNGNFLSRQNQNVVSQYSEVSHGQFELVPATGLGIRNGVAQIRLDTRVAGSKVEDELSLQVLDAAVQQLGGAPLEQIADRFIFCLPNASTLGGRDSWTAFTYLFEPVREGNVPSRSCGAFVVSSLVADLQHRLFRLLSHS